MRAHGIPTKAESTGSIFLTINQSTMYLWSKTLFWSVPSKPLLWTLVYYHPDKMNKTFLIIIICFLANTQGSTRTRRALPPGYLSVDGTEYCLETEKMPGTSSSYLCIPARKPWCCPQLVWNNLNSESLGLDHCQITNLDPCGESLKNNWRWSMVQNN